MQNIHNYETELQAQSTYRLLFVSGNFLYFLLFAVIGINGHEVVALLAFAVQAFYFLRTWPPKLREFRERLKVIAFKQQVHNLYVFSLEPEDDTVVARFREAVEFLKQVENEHGVTVYLVIFHDACIFSARWKSDGKLHEERRWREEGSTFETWEEFEAFVERFILEDNDKRLRQLRSDDQGRAWVDGNIFGQYRQDNG